MEGLLLDLDNVLELRNTATALLQESQEPMRTYGSADIALVARKARSLLAFTAARGWPAVARLVSPAPRNPQLLSLQPC